MVSMVVIHISCPDGPARFGTIKASLHQGQVLEQDHTNEGHHKGLTAGTVAAPVSRINHSSVQRTKR